MLFLAITPASSSTTFGLFVRNLEIYVAWTYLPSLDQDSGKQSRDFANFSLCVWNQTDKAGSYTLITLSAGVSVTARSPSSVTVLNRNTSCSIANFACHWSPMPIFLIALVQLLTCPVMCCHFLVLEETTLEKTAASFSFNFAETCYSLGYLNLNLPRCFDPVLALSVRET